MARNGEWATGRMGAWRVGVSEMANGRERLKTGAAGLQKERHARRAEFFALPISPSAQTAAVVGFTDYWLLTTGNCRITNHLSLFTVPLPPCSASGY